MKKKMDITKLSQQLIKIFSDYAINLDEYFKNDDNKSKHSELYDYYKKLIDDIARIKEIK